MSDGTLVAGLALAVAVGVIPRLRQLAPPLIATLQAGALPTLLATAALAAMLGSAGDVAGLDATAYRQHFALFGSGSLALLWLLALRFEGLVRRCFDALVQVSPAVWAAFVFSVGLAANLLVFDGIPHTSDENAYLFQAKALSRGLLGLPPPPHFDFFGFVHLSVHDGLWHGIFPPGWPALLALGVLVGAEAAVSPLLAAATIPLLHGALARAGFTREVAGLAALLYAISPLPLFLAGTTMSHSANAALFALFLWSWVRLHAEGRLRWAALAGLALGWNALLRPLDSGAAALPFGIHAATVALRDRSRWPQLAVAGGLAAAGLGTLLAYNATITGDPLMLPQELHFTKGPPGERFGWGFGPEMGTKAHGEEWPGYFPSDAPRVTSHRLLVWLADLHGAPLVALAVTFAVALGAARSGRRSQRGPPWQLLLLASAAAVVLAYVPHFYHGIVYGSRHFALAVPALVAAIAIGLGGVLSEAASGASDPSNSPGDASRVARATAVRAGTLALIVHTAVFALPPLLREYGSDYREASGAVREASSRQQLTHALVFVHSDRWGWKSAFPLNDYPLESNDVLYAQDLGRRNAELRSAFPARPAFRARFLKGGRVRLFPLRNDPDAGLIPGRDASRR